MSARIFRPGRGATQSGRARTKAWVLDYEPAVAREIEPLMGWTSSSDMNSQVRLTFATKEEAIAFAEKRGIAYRVEEPAPTPERRGLSYSDNFKTSRMGQWTH
ncbi:MULTISPECIES: ETC complex I subunit [Lichenihabitans]|uniref:ETC complex I subunit n=1 Tax=Lichenihabitans TaxID=2723776 RepID=UPI0010365C3D|nr:MULTISPECIES: ETC complex I subunit [Lichenihabitans]UDL95089.1 ETC complex I subunit [Lichenihabitans sp. PAMC28606]